MSLGETNLFPFDFDVASQEKGKKKQKSDSIKNEDRLGLDGKLFMHVGVSVGMSLLLKTDFLC